MFVASIMQYNTETKIRSSESSSNDSGVIADESLICTDGEMNVSTAFKHNTDKSGYDNDINEVTCKIQNGDDKVHYTISSDTTKPNSSPESTHISIESIDEDAVDSSVIDSDSDLEDLPKNGEFIIEKLGQHVAKSEAKNGIIIVSQNPIDKLGESSSVATATPRPQIGSIAVQNSTDITFGDKTFYQGPVTIKQFLLENNKWKPKDANGSVNGGFDGSDTESKNGKTNGNAGSTKKEEKFRFNTKSITITSGIIFTVFLIITIILTAILLRKSKSLTSQLGDGDDSRINNPISSTIGEDNIGGGKVLRFISRAEWVAQPARHTLNDLELPAKRVIIAHTATEQCSTQASCTFHVRLVQTFHMESRNWDDISYNFLVGGDGAVYEGRGWNKEGAHTKGFNKKSICIAFVGTFTDIVPPDRQLNVTQLLIEEGLRLKKIAPDYKLFGHRQLIPSESPGKKLYEIIQKWPHWSDDISDN